MQRPIAFLLFLLSAIAWGLTVVWTRSTWANRHLLFVRLHHPQWLLADLAQTGTFAIIIAINEALHESHVIIPCRLSHLMSALFFLSCPSAVLGRGVQLWHALRKEMMMTAGTSTLPPPARHISEEHFNNLVVACLPLLMVVLVLGLSLDGKGSFCISRRCRRSGCSLGSQYLLLCPVMLLIYAHIILNWWLLQRMHKVGRARMEVERLRTVSELHRFALYPLPLLTLGLVVMLLGDLGVVSTHAAHGLSSLCWMAALLAKFAIMHAIPSYAFSYAPRLTCRHRGRHKVMPTLPILAPSLSASCGDAEGQREEEGRIVSSDEGSGLWEGTQPSAALLSPSNSCSFLQAAAASSSLLLLHEDEGGEEAQQEGEGKPRRASFVSASQLSTSLFASWERGRPSSSTGNGSSGGSSSSGDGGGGGEETSTFPPAPSPSTIITSSSPCPAPPSPSTITTTAAAATTTTTTTTFSCSPPPPSPSTTTTVAMATSMVSVHDSIDSVGGEESASTTVLIADGDSAMRVEATPPSEEAVARQHRRSMKDGSVINTMPTFIPAARLPLLDMTLGEIIDGVDGGDILRDLLSFCEAILCDHMLHFLLALRPYQKLDYGSQRLTPRVMPEEVVITTYHTYIREGAPCPVPLPRDLVEAIGRYCEPKAGDVFRRWQTWLPLHPITERRDSGFNVTGRRASSRSSWRPHDNSSRSSREGGDVAGTLLSSMSTIATLMELAYFEIETLLSEEALPLFRVYMREQQQQQQQQQQHDDDNCCAPPVAPLPSPSCSSPTTSGPPPASCLPPVDAAGSEGMVCGMVRGGVDMPPRCFNIEVAEEAENTKELLALLEAEMHHDVDHLSQGQHHHGHQKEGEREEEGREEEMGWIAGWIREGEGQPEHLVGDIIIGSSSSSNNTGLNLDNKAAASSPSPPRLPLFPESPHALLGDGNDGHHHSSY